MAQSDLTIRIGGDLTDLRSAIAAVRADLNQLKGGLDKTGDAGRGIERIESRMDGAATAARRLVGAIAGIAAGTGLIALADNMATLSARLRIATNTAEEFNRAQQALFDLSQRTRSGLTATVDLYQRIALATRDAGIGQETLLEVVETINQAMQLSGASAESANAALIQLGQGLASGTLRGEELNSILEQTPVLADAIARGMGITRGELRKYGEEGKITAQAVIESLQSQRAELAAQFQQLPLTVGQSITLVSNAFQRLVGEFNDASSSTQGLAGAIRAIADFLSSDGVLSTVVQLATAVGDGFRAFAEDASRAIETVQQATAGWTRESESLFGFLFRAFRDLPTNLRTAVRVATVTFANFVANFSAGVTEIKESLAALVTRDTLEAARARRNAAVDRNNAVARQLIDEITAEAVRTSERAAQAGQAAVDRRAQGRVPTGTRGTGRPQRPTARDGNARSFTGPQVDADQLLRDQTERSLNALEILYRDAEITAREFFARRAALQEQAIDAEIAQERRKLDAAVAARNQQQANNAATNIARLEAQRADLAVRNAREEELAAREAADRRVQITAQRLEQEGRLEDAARARLGLQFRDTLARLRAEGDTAGVTIIESIIDTEAARARFSELQRIAERAQGELQSRIQSIANQRDAGTLSFGQAEQEVASARARAFSQLQTVNQELQALAARANDPQITAGAESITVALERLRRDGLTGLDLAVANLRGSLDNMQRNFASTAISSGANALQQLFSNLATGSMSAGEAFRAFALNVVSQLASMAAQALATRIALAALGFAGGVGGLNPISAFVNHSGGAAGTGPRRSVSPWVFAGAPRLHSGLKPDEFPAILQMGEQVIAKDDPANARNGGGGVRVINVVDPNLVNDYMQSASGERTIVNTIQRNRGQIRQLLG